MADMKVPGIKAKHAVITDECRKLHGDVHAFNKAAFRLLSEYDAITRLRGDAQGVKYHLVLTVENPTQVTKRKPRGGHMASMPEPTQAVT